MILAQYGDVPIVIILFPFGGIFFGLLGLLASLPGNAFPRFSYWCGFISIAWLLMILAIFGDSGGPYGFSLPYYALSVFPPLIAIIRAKSVLDKIPRK